MTKEKIRGTSIFCTNNKNVLFTYRDPRKHTIMIIHE